MGTTNKHKVESNKLVISYLTLRNLIGFGGMLLPVILALKPTRRSDYYGFEPSISDYFYTDRGDILVVVLCIIGAFLITYSGYTTKEWLLTTFAGICGIGVAFVPTGMACADCAHSVHTSNGGIFKTLAGTWWHFAFAASFLLSLAIMSLIYFTKGHEGESHRKVNGSRTQKGKRNLAFRICGWTIIGSLIVLGAYFVYNEITHKNLKPFPFVYFFETVAVEAFGFAWLVKGETLWPDGEHYVKKTLKKLKEKYNKKNHYNTNS